MTPSTAGVGGLSRADRATRRVRTGRQEWRIEDALAGPEPWIIGL
jgi:hypothetical protein